MRPFLDHLSPVANYSIKSQWLYFLPLDVTPKQVSDDSAWNQHYVLPEEVLPQLITPLEKKLGTCVKAVSSQKPVGQFKSFILIS